MEKTDPRTRRLVNDLRSSAKNKDYFRRLAEYIEKPSRKMPQVNVSKVGKLCKSGEEVAVPGKVLGFGEISSKVNVYAMAFSKQAEGKIEASGGKCMRLEELLKKDKCARIII